MITNQSDDLDDGSECAKNARSNLHTFIEARHSADGVNGLAHRYIGDFSDTNWYKESFSANETEVHKKTLGIKLAQNLMAYTITKRYLEVDIEDAIEHIKQLRNHKNKTPPDDNWQYYIEGCARDLADFIAIDQRFLKEGWLTGESPISEEIRTLRRINLQRAVDYFGGRDEFAKALKEAQINLRTKNGNDANSKEQDNAGANSDLGKMLNGYFGGKRSQYIYEAARQLAKHKENCDKRYFDEKWLDMRTAITYLLADVSLETWRTVSNELRKLSEIQEVSLIFGNGDYNSLIKLESPVELLSGKVLDLIRKPYIRKAQSLWVTPFSHWQRQQSYMDDDLDKLLSDTQDLMLTPFIETKFATPSISNMFRAEWERNKNDTNDVAVGRMKISQADLLNTFPETIVQSAQDRILAVVVWHNAIAAPGERDRGERYLTAQAQKLKAARDSGKAFMIKRVFVVENSPSCFENDTTLSMRIGHELAIGIEVKYISGWSKLSLENEPEDFGLIDNIATWRLTKATNNEEMRIIDLQYNLDSDRYFNSINDKFNRIWNYASTLSPDLQDYCIKAYEATRSGEQKLREW